MENVIGRALRRRIEVSPDNATVSTRCGVFISARDTGLNISVCGGRMKTVIGTAVRRTPPRITRLHHGDAAPWCFYWVDFWAVRGEDWNRYGY